MSIDSRLDRTRTPVVPGIPGASRQLLLPKKASKSRSSAHPGSGRSRRRAIRAASSQALNGLLADSMMLYDHYGRYLWLLSDHTSCQLNVLLGKHTDEQRELIDLIVERVRELGAATTVPLQVAELTVVSRPLKGVGDVPAMLAGLLEAHELIIGRIREAITMTATSRDRETNDLLRDALRRHESQAWSIADHIAESDAKRA